MTAAKRGEEPVRQLLADDEPAPYAIVNPQGRSRFLLVADHAGALLPRSLGDLGLSGEDRARHIAVDLGVAELGPALARRLDAVSMAQGYSRLVIDCNREPGRADACPAVSDGSVVPGNRDLTEDQRRARVEAIHAPYHAAIADELARRDAAGLLTVVVALHSFTPRLSANRSATLRPWHAGVLYGGGDESFARAALARLRARLPSPVGDNEPYAMDGIDYTIPHHCFARGRPYVEFEVRQDLLTAPAGVEYWAALLADVLLTA